MTDFAVLADDGKARLVELSPRGRPTPTGEARRVQDADLIRDVVWWGEGVMGIAELTYPHPQGWTVEGACGAPTLDKLTVKTLTGVFRSKGEKPPACMEAWAKRLEGPIPWQGLGLLFQGGMLTPRDHSSYFKNILHRAFLTRSRRPAEDGSTSCRCCGAGREDLVHFAHCSVLRPCWDRLLALCGEAHGAKVVLLGATESGRLLPRGLLMLWVILWKFVIIELTQVGLGEATTVDTERIWEQAVRRLVTRVNAAVFSFRQAMVSAEGKGHSPPSPSSLNVALEPLAEVDATGALSWSAQMRAHLLAAKAVPEDTAEPPVRPIHATKCSNTSPQATPHCLHASEGGWCGGPGRRRTQGGGGSRQVRVGDDTLPQRAAFERGNHRLLRTRQGRAFETDQGDGGGLPAGEEEH